MNIVLILRNVNAEEQRTQKKKHLCLTSNNKQPATCLNYIILQKTTSFPPAGLVPGPESSFFQLSHWNLHNIHAIATSATINTVASLHPAHSGF